MTTGPAEIGVGVIGVGVAGRFHARVFTELPGARVAALWGRTPERARRVAARFPGAAVEHDIEALADRDDVDLVCVTTPPALHLAGVTAAVGAGKAVLCEKPFALDREEALLIHQMARDAGVPNFVNFEFRCSPGRARLRELVRDGFVGDVRTVHMVASNDYLHVARGYIPPWHPRATEGGGWLGAAGSHDVDALRFVVGEITEVCADLPRFVSTHGARGGTEVESDVDDAFALLVHFANGASGVVASSAVAVTATALPRLEVVGTDGTLVLTTEGRFGGPTASDVRLLGARGSGAALEPIAVAVPEAVDDDPHHDPFTVWASAIVAAVRERRGASPDFEDGWRNQAVLDAARTSALDRRWVDVAASQPDRTG